MTVFVSITALTVFVAVAALTAALRDRGVRGSTVCQIKINEVIAAIHLKPQLTVVDIPSDVYRLIRIVVDIPIHNGGAKRDASFYVRVPVVCHIRIEGQRTVQHRHNIKVFVIVEKFIIIDLDRILVKNANFGVLISRACNRHFAAVQAAAVGHSVEGQNLTFKRRTVLIKIGGIAAALASALTAALTAARCGKRNERRIVCREKEGARRARFLELDLGGIAVGEPNLKVCDGASIAFPFGNEAEFTDGIIMQIGSVVCRIQERRGQSPDPLIEEGVMIRSRAGCPSAVVQGIVGVGIATERIGSAASLFKIDVPVYPSGSILVAVHHKGAGGGIRRGAGIGHREVAVVQKGFVRKDIGPSFLRHLIAGVKAVAVGVRGNGGTHRAFRRGGHRQTDVHHGRAVCHRYRQMQNVRAGNVTERKAVVRGGEVVEIFVFFRIVALKGSKLRHVAVVRHGKGAKQDAHVADKLKGAVLEQRRIRGGKHLLRLLTLLVVLRLDVDVGDVEPLSGEVAGDDHLARTLFAVAALARALSAVATLAGALILSGGVVRFAGSTVFSISVFAADPVLVSPLTSPLIAV